MPSNGLLNEERRREILSVLHRDGRVLPVNAVDEAITAREIPKPDFHALEQAGVKVTLV